MSALQMLVLGFNLFVRDILHLTADDDSHNLNVYDVISAFHDGHNKVGLIKLMRTLATPVIHYEPLPAQAFSDQENRNAKYLEQTIIHYVNRACAIDKPSSNLGLWEAKQWTDIMMLACVTHFSRQER